MRQLSDGTGERAAGRQSPVLVTERHSRSTVVQLGHGQVGHRAAAGVIVDADVARLIHVVDARPLAHVPANCQAM